MKDDQGRAVVLFGHGARDPQWAEPMQRTRERLLALEPGVKAELAFLELMSPGLEEAIDRLVAEGVTSITVVPMFLARGGHLRRDLPQLIEAARLRHPACHITQVPAVGEVEDVIAAMALYARNCARGGVP